MTKPHRCLTRKLRRSLDHDAIFHCHCGIHWMFNGVWERAEYDLRYLNGPMLWSLWTRRYHSTEAARMTTSASRNEAKQWARDLLLRDDAEVIKFSTNVVDYEATTYHIHYAPVTNGLRAAARSEIP